MRKGSDIRDDGTKPYQFHGIVDPATFMVWAFVPDPGATRIDLYIDHGDGILDKLRITDLKNAA